MTPLTIGQALAQARMHVAADAENPQIIPSYRSLLLEPTGTAAGAVLLLPGYTSPTDQFADLGAVLAQHGYYAYIPRAPRHGMQDGPARIAPTAAELRAYARAGAVIVRGLGPHDSGVMGLSGGGGLAVWLMAQPSTTLRRMVILNPFFEPAPNLVPKWQLQGLLTMYGRLRWLPDKPDLTSENRTYYGLASYMTLAKAVRGRKMPTLDVAALVTSPGDDQVDLVVARSWFYDWFPQGQHLELPADWGLQHDIVGRSSLGSHAVAAYESYVAIYMGKPANFGHS